MGYYSQMNEIPFIRKDKIKEFEKEANRLRALSDKEKPEWVYTWLEPLDLETTTQEPYSLEYDEYYAKWYDLEDFAEWFAKYAEEGLMTFTGEDGERYGIYFDGKGKWTEAVYTEVWELPKKTVKCVLSFDPTRNKEVTLFVTDFEDAEKIREYLGEGLNCQVFFPEEE